MSLYLSVALGSAIGGVLRFALGTLIQQKTGATFPVGTLAINFCRGYTTFSTFTYETAALIEDGDYRRAFRISRSASSSHSVARS